jgi:hypothetical protein
MNNEEMYYGGLTYTQYVMWEMLYFLKTSCKISYPSIREWDACLDKVERSEYARIDER